MHAAVSLSIKNVPYDLATALGERAKRNHRSIQGELMDILKMAVGAKPFDAAGLRRQARQLGLKTPSESVQIIREMRDTR
jgi:plasmid stability protein